MASPELLPDDKRDYIIYAVDPEETLRASQLRSSPTRSSSSSNSSRERNDASSSKLSSSPSRPKDAPSSILVGKGFFNWALEEEGEGDTTVTGRVRSDGRRLRYDNGREYEEDINVLEVVIKLKESQARSKDKYFNLVRGLNTGSSFSAAASTSNSSSSTAARSALPRHASDVQVASSTQRFRSARHVDSDSQLSLHSEPDYPTSSSSHGAVERQIRRPNRRPSPRYMPLPDRQSDRVISPKTTTQPLGPSPSLPTVSTFSAASSSPAPSAASTTSAPSSAASNPSALQLLTILHSLQQRSSKSAPEPAQQAQLENLLQQVAHVFGNSASPAADSGATTESSAAGPSSVSPALAARPLDAIPVPNVRLPLLPVDSHLSKDNRKASFSAQSASKDSPLVNSRRQSVSSPSFDEGDTSTSSLQGKDGPESSSRICYNCGTDVPTTWRILTLPAGSIVNHPSAEKGGSSEANNDDSAQPGWKPRYAGKDTPIETDGQTRWSACNPCGLYYLKWNNSRPEYVWRKEHATKAYRERKALAEAAKRRREGVDAGSNKRARIANSDVDGASPYSATTPGNASFGMTSPNFDADTPASGSGRKGSMPRTLSEACHRDAEKLESQRSSKKKDKEKPVCKKQADREYVLDQATGKWRSRRSMRENPAGKRPGRPKGSFKAAQSGNKSDAKSSPVKDETKTGSTPLAQQSTAEASSTSAKSVNAGSSSSESGSKGKSTQQHSAQQDTEFRAPMPPQLPRQASSRMVNFAQSSPVRPSMNASLMQADAVNAMPTFGSGMLESPSRDIRFRVPSYLMNSSPGTMLDTLMSEADFDFEELGPLGPLQTPGTLLGQMSRNGFTPQQLRRSPRKNPHGTISGQNPYASPSAQRSTGSPSFVRGGQLNLTGSPDARSAALSSSDSPVTRSRTRSGQDVLHPALFSSSDGVTNDASAKSSSNVTSPASPSEKNSRAAASKGKTISSLHSVGKSRLSSRQAKVEKSAKSRARSADVDADEEDNAPEAQFTRGPYRKTGDAPSREGSAGLPSCPASPSLGRATRKLARELSTASAQSLHNNGPAKLAQLDLPPSSPVFDHPTGGTVEVDGWGRTPSMREIFPTPSDLDWPSDGSPATQPGDEVKHQDQQVAESKDLAIPPPTTQAIVRRRPLPATVEDGSSSVSGSSPALSSDDYSPEPGANRNLFDLFEDPYGILAASGFGIDANGGLTSLEIPVPPPAGTGTSMTPTSTSATPAVAPAISADKFNDVQLHPSTEFGTHLSDFSATGGTGVAAHVAGSSGTAAAVQIAAPTDSTSTANMNFDASFLANLPPELSSILASPKKQLPPKIIEILASPRKNRSSASVSPTKGGEMVHSPAFAGIGAGLGAAGVEGADGGEHDFSALFSNPDIQALLAEFEASA